MKKIINIEIIIFFIIVIIMGYKLGIEIIPKTNPYDIDSGGLYSIKGGSSDKYTIEQHLPDYVINAQCGDYFKEYKLCGGTCIEGTCVRDGNSCYCKILD